jgi:hypothetical protein
MAQTARNGEQSALAGIIVRALGNKVRLMSIIMPAVISCLNDNVGGLYEPPTRLMRMLSPIKPLAGVSLS